MDSSSFASGPGIMETRILSSPAVRRRTIWVAERVQRSLATGNDKPVRPSRREDLPEDWSPTTTSYKLNWKDGILVSLTSRDCESSLSRYTYERQYIPEEVKYLRPNPARGIDLLRSRASRGLDSQNL